MCGLFGVASTYVSKNEMEFFSDLGIVSQFRGMHSTGLAFASREGKRRNTGPTYSIFKNEYDPAAFFGSTDVQTLLSGAGRFAVIGHCRHATVGDHTIEAAHPYEVGNFIGAHNGTVMNIKQVSDPTDSHAIYRIMDAEGVEAAVNQANKGAYALTFFDKKAGTLNLTRNKERPLSLARIGGAWYWCSESDMIEFIAKRNKVTIGRMIDLQPGVLYQMKLGTMDLTDHKLNIEPAKTYSYNLTHHHRSFGRSIQHQADDSRTGYPKKAENSDIPFVPSVPQTLGKANDNTTHDLTKIAMMAERVAWAGTNASTTESARAVFKNRADLPPAVLLYDNKAKASSGKNGKTKAGTQVYKVLRFKGPDGRKFLDVDDANELLERGCAVSGSVPTINQTVYWISDTDFVLPDYRDVDIVKELLQHQNRRAEPGYAVYVSPTLLKSLHN